MADSHHSDTDQSAQQLVAQLDATQMVLNVAETLPIFTSQIIEDLRNGSELILIERQLVCLHHTLLQLSKTVGKTNLVRVSSILYPQNNESMRMS